MILDCSHDYESDEDECRRRGIRYREEIVIPYARE